MEDGIEVITSAWYDADLRDLPEDDQRRISNRLKMFGTKGWRQAIGDQTVKHLHDGIYEVRVLGRGAAYRVLFFVMPGRSPRVVVLTACAAKSTMKKRQRFDAEIERARARRDRWLEQERKGG